MTPPRIFFAGRDFTVKTEDSTWDLSWDLKRSGGEVDERLPRDTKDRTITTKVEPIWCGKCSSYMKSRVIPLPWYQDVPRVVRERMAEDLEAYNMSQEWLPKSSC